MLRRTGGDAAAARGAGRHLQVAAAVQAKAAAVHLVGSPVRIHAGTSAARLICEQCRKVRDGPRLLVRVAFFDGMQCDGRFLKLVGHRSGRDSDSLGFCREGARVGLYRGVFRRRWVLFVVGSLRFQGRSRSKTTSKTCVMRASDSRTITRESICINNESYSTHRTVFFMYAPQHCYGLMLFLGQLWGPSATCPFA